MSKTLVIYFSAQGHTKKIAEQIAENLGADLFEITPKQAYTEDDLDWTDDNSRATREHADPTLRDVELTTTDISNWSDYDTILIGYPIWWGISAWAVNSFIKAQDFAGKTVIPFCVSHSSDLGDSAKLLQADAAGGDWQAGHRFYQDASASDIKSWSDSLA